MKIYIWHSRELDYTKELYEPIRNSHLNKEHEFVLPHEIYANAKDFVTTDIIRVCDLMIAEVSFPATGLGIELWHAHAFGCPILCVSKKGAKISNALHVICDDFIEYSDTSDLMRQISDYISTKNK